MPKWDQWIDDDEDGDLELVEDYQYFEPIKRKKKKLDDDESSNISKKRKNDPEK